MRYRDAARFRVWRDLQLELNGSGTEQIRVYEDDVVVWVTEDA
jgi:hypothetical protein